MEFIHKFLPVISFGSTGTGVRREIVACYGFGKIELSYASLYIVSFFQRATLLMSSGNGPLDRSLRYRLLQTRLWTEHIWG